MRLRRIRKTNTDISVLGAVGAGSNAGPHFCWGYDLRQNGNRSILAASATPHSVPSAYGSVFTKRIVMTDLCKLRGEHTDIQKIVRKLRYLISQPSPPPQLHLFALRHELSSTLISHLKTEDWLLYPQLMASADAQIAATARAFSEEMGGLAVAYRDHCQYWNADAIAADWAGYCRDSRGLIDALNNRITRENRDLYPLLERLDQAA